MIGISTSLVLGFTAFLAPTILGATVGTRFAGASGSFGTYGFLSVIGSKTALPSGMWATKLGISTIGTGMMTTGIIGFKTMLNSLKSKTKRQ